MNVEIASYATSRASADPRGGIGKPSSGSLSLKPDKHPLNPKRHKSAAPSGRVGARAAGFALDSARYNLKNHTFTFPPSLPLIFWTNRPAFVILVPNGAK